MKIAIVGELRAPINKNTTSGTETWAYNFAEELVKRGHKVTLFASAGSKFMGKVIKVCNRSEINYPANKSEAQFRNVFFVAEEAAEVIRQQDKFDIIHFSIFDFYYIVPFVKLIKKPIFITIHGFVFSNDFAKLIFKKFPEIKYIFISKFYSKTLPKPQKYKIIQNGIDIKNFTFSDKEKDYYLWINRVDKVKGAEHAVEFAKRTHSKLFIAGPIRDQEYFNSEIKPNLSSNILYLGQLSLLDKIKYYKNAKALLMTINWEEPFGLTVIESMACGTPVIAFNRGAMSELIKNGINGYLVDFQKGTTGIIKAIKTLESLSAEEYKQMRYTCRKYIEENFTLDKMVDNYLNFYKEIIGHNIHRNK